MAAAKHNSKKMANVKIKTFEPKQKRDSVQAHRKEKYFTQGVYALARNKQTGRLVSVVDLRFYAPNIVCYCVVWVSFAGGEVFGCGQEGGYGGDKKGMAAWKALADCGIQVEGVAGTGLVSDAVELLGRHICEASPDYEFLGVFEAHG